MSQYIVLVLCLAAGYLSVWFSEPNRKDKIALFFGLCIGCTVYFAIDDSTWFLLALLVFVPVAIWRTVILRKRVAVMAA